MREFIKALAYTAKVGAILFWLGIGWVTLNLDISDLRSTSQPQYREAPQDWGTPQYFRRTYLRIPQTILLLFAALIPNRFLVSSPIMFVLSLILALSPLLALAHTSLSFHSIGEFILSAFVVLLILALYAPLPLSIVLSLLRLRRGERVTYA